MNLSNAAIPAAIFSKFNDITKNIADINIAVIAFPKLSGITNVKIQEDIVIAAAIPTNVVIRTILLILSLSNTATPSAILSRLSATTANIAEIKIPVNACVKEIGVMSFKIQEDIVIAADIETNAINKAVLLTLSLLNTPTATNMFSKCEAITANIAAINIAVNV